MQVIGPTNPFRADLLHACFNNNGISINGQDVTSKTITDCNCCKYDTCLVFVVGVVHSGVAMSRACHKLLVPGFVVVKVLLAVLGIIPCPQGDVKTRLSEQDCRFPFLRRHTAYAQFSVPGMIKKPLCLHGRALTCPNLP